MVIRKLFLSYIWIQLVSFVPYYIKKQKNNKESFKHRFSIIQTFNVLKILKIIINRKKIATNYRHRKWNLSKKIELIQEELNLYMNLVT